MFCGIPQTVEDAITVMRSEPDAAFIRVRLKDELLIAVRTDDGAVSAYRCRILGEACEAPAARPEGESRHE
jgi:hypothetical protein